MTKATKRKATKSRRLKSEPSGYPYYEAVYDTMKRQRDAALRELNSRANLEITAKRAAEATEQFGRTIATLQDGRDAAQSLYEHLQDLVSDLKELDTAIAMLRLQVRARARRAAPK